TSETGASETGAHDDSSESEDLRLREEETLRSAINTFLERQKQYVKERSKNSDPARNSTAERHESVASKKEEVPSVKNIIDGFEGRESELTVDTGRSDFDRIYAELRAKKSNGTLSVPKNSDTGETVV